MFDPGRRPTLPKWEERQRQREASLERSRKEHAKATEAKRKTARVVTANDFDRQVPADLRAAAVRLLGMGGDLKASGGRLLVSLPPNEVKDGGLGLALAAYLYTAEEHVLKIGEDQPVQGSRSAHPALGRPRPVNVAAELTRRRAARGPLDDRLLALGFRVGHH
jgi:hypothetical protein